MPNENESGKCLGRVFSSRNGVQMPAEPTKGFEAITWEQASEMDSNGISIECHTVNHPILPSVSAEELKSELTDSKVEIEERLNKECRHFCYPNGSFDERVVDAVRDAGFSTATTTNYGFVESASDPFLLKRIDGQPSIANFAQSVSGFEKFREKIGI